MGHKIGYARVSTADQNPQMQIDALAGEDCLKTYIDTATGTKADRPQWVACLADLRPGDTLIIWKIDRLGRDLRDLIDIVTGVEARGVVVKSLTNGIVDTTTAHGTLIFGMFALMAGYEAALIKERAVAGLVAARAGGRKPKMTPELIDRAQRMYDPHVQHGRDRRVVRRHPHDDLPKHPHRQRPSSRTRVLAAGLISGVPGPELPSVTRALPGDGGHLPTNGLSHLRRRA